MNPIVKAEVLKSISNTFTIAGSVILAACFSFIIYFMEIKKNALTIDGFYLMGMAALASMGMGIVVRYMAANAQKQIPTASNSSD